MTEKAHVVMMVANDIGNDSRVLKEAGAIARTGVRVTLLGVSARGGGLSMESLDGTAVMARLPGAFPLRDERTRRRGRRRGRRLPFVGYRLTSQAVARRVRITARRADLKAASGRAVADRRAGSVGPLRYKSGVVGRALQTRFWQVAAQGVRVRGLVTRHQEQWFTSGWGAWDKLVSNAAWPVSWRGVVPEAYDYEQIFGKVLDELAPDVLHAHDMHLVGVAARAAGRAKLRGRELKVIYDAHEYVPGLSRYGARTARFISAWAHHEREYIGTADRVITVSPAIARTLHERYSLEQEPTVIINTPSRSDAESGVVDLRSRLGLPAEVPLLVYSGGVTRARGVETAIQALPHLPGVHLAVVAVPSIEIRSVRELRKLAASLRVEDRVHYADPVEPDEVVAFLRTADIGLIPILRYPSHEMALPNKVFEYVFAGLPVVTSDMPSLTEFVERTGIGEAFEVENPVDLAAKVTRILDNPAPYREQAGRPDFQREVSWEGQVSRLQELYGELLGQKVTTENRPAVQPRVLIGPANTGGQAWRWARAIERHEPSFAAQSLQVGEDGAGFPADRVVAGAQYRSSVGWRIELADYLVGNVTHVLFEAGRPVLGQSRGEWFDKDLRLLESAGIKSGVVVHDAETIELLGERLADFKGPRFVTAPELLELVDDSEWLPVVVDVHNAHRPLLEREVPVVLRVLSGREPSGSALIDPVLGELQARGVIEYQRVEGIAHLELIADADIVVDDLQRGSYGVVACEAMAAGRIVIGQVSDRVRALVPGAMPLVEATPATLAEVIEGLVADRVASVKAAAAGPGFVREFHDGRRSVEVLQSFLH